MKLQQEEIGKVMGLSVYHGIVRLDFEDYDNLFIRLRGKKPIRTEVYTASEEKGRDYMLGFDFLWDDGSVERMSFKDFWHLFSRNWYWGSNEEYIGGWYDRDGKWIERYATLSWKYTEIVFQTHPHGGCAFDRIHNRVTGCTQDINAMREGVKRFEGKCNDFKASGAWVK